MAVGVYVGWHLRHATGGNSDLRVPKSRIPDFRKTRNRSGLMIAALVVFTLLVCAPWCGSRGHVPARRAWSPPA